MPLPPQAQVLRWVANERASSRPQSGQTIPYKAERYWAAEGVPGAVPFAPLQPGGVRYHELIIDPPMPSSLYQVASGVAYELPAGVPESAAPKDDGTVSYVVRREPGRLLLMVKNEGTTVGWAYRLSVSIVNYHQEP